MASAVDGSYMPPPFQYYDTDEIRVFPGRYYAVGNRVCQQYQNLDCETYWDVASQLTPQVGGTYSAGSSPGILGGKVAWSWYSIFMLGDSVNNFMALPYIRPKSVDYDVSHSGKTTCNLYNLDDASSTENGYLTANDQWNGYRIVNLLPAWNACSNQANPALAGMTFTIEDCINGTDDELIFDGDQTDGTPPDYKIHQGWIYQLIPPSGTDFLYLGSVRTNESLNIEKFWRAGWHTRFQWSSSYALQNSTSANDNDFLLRGACPTAAWVHLSIALGNASEYREAVIGDFFCGTTGGDNCESLLYIDVGDRISAHLEMNRSGLYAPRFASPLDWMLSHTQMIRNRVYARTSSTEYTLQSYYHAKVHGYTE